MKHVSFFHGAHPGANAVLLHGARPVLVDSGFGSQADALAAWLRGQGVAPERLALVVNTHHHSDHVGGNFLFRRLGVPIAAHAVDAALVNARDPEACSAAWLRQPAPPYAVAQPLDEGDEIDTGAAVWRVLHTPGHTFGHISLWCARERVLIAGDAVHADDLGWLAPCRDGPRTLAWMRASVARLAALDVAVSLSGHGPACRDFAAACAAAEARLGRWERAPERMAWHACKRVFASALMIAGGMTEAGLRNYLLDAPWFCDHARAAFGVEPAELVAPMVTEMLRSGAAARKDARLVATAPHDAVPPRWAASVPMPADWPPP